MSNRLDCMNVASALAGAVALASLASGASAAEIKGMEPCYGIAAAGQNSCANQTAGHSCAGMSKVAYSGQDFRVVKEGTCEGLGGKLQAFEGINPNAKKS
jgi:uncharacterized membrane protein